ncbi:MAG: yiaA/B two helix domain protein [Pseudonocardiales bacterium]|nr:yiaA/B two helix domain protein [Pseudonocardiales bacterium]
MLTRVEAGPGQTSDMTTSPQSKTTYAFMIQAVVSFGIAVLFLAGSVAYLPIDGWPRACIGLTGLFLVTSTFTLAKVVRDQQESGSVVNRLDDARLERLLAEYDPYKIPQLPPVAHQNQQAPNYSAPNRPMSAPAPR